MQHSTTKNEKLNILKRFDTISTIKESKNLYSSIKSELDTKKPMTESVVEKLISTPTTSSTAGFLAIADPANARVINTDKTNKIRNFIIIS